VLTRQLVGITAAIPPFVVMLNHGPDVPGEVDTREQLHTCNRVLLHQCSFFWSELPWLVQNF